MGRVGKIFLRISASTSGGSTSSRERRKCLQTRTATVKLTWYWCRLSIWEMTTCEVIISAKLYMIILAIPKVPYTGR